MRDLLVTVIVFGLLPFCLTRPWIGILTWNWLGMMTPHMLAFGFARTIPYAMLVAGATLAGIAFTKDRKPIPWNRELVLLLLLTAHFALTSSFAWLPAQAWDRYWDFLKMIFMAVLATMVIYGHERMRWLLGVIALSIGYYGLKGGVWSLATGGQDSVLGPPGSYLSGNTFIGLAFVMTIPLMLAVAKDVADRRIKWLFLVVAFFTAISTVFTYSRGALLGLIVTAPFLFLRSRKKVFVLLLLIPLALVGKEFIPERWYKKNESAVNYEQDESAMQRFNAWTIHFNVGVEHPIVGGGFNFNDWPDIRRFYAYGNPDLRHIMSEEHGVAAHSSYFQMLGQHGFVGLFLFLALLGSAYRSLARIGREASRHPDLGWIASYASAVRIALIGFAASGAFLSVAYFELLYLLCIVPALLQRDLASALASTSAMSAAPGMPVRVNGILVRPAAPGPS